MPQTAETEWRFVLRPASADPAAHPAPPLPAEPLAGARPGWLLARPAGGTLRQAWQALQHEVGPAFQVLPELRDDQGTPRYPTGEIVVRFKSAVSDQRLAELAASFDLLIRKRSAFTQNQAVFRPRDAHRVFAPELAQALPARCDDIESVWLDAEGRYRRQP